MVLGRIFGRGSKGEGDAGDRSLEDEETVADGEDAGGAENGGGEPEELPEGLEAIDWRRRAEALIPGGASTGSKRHRVLYGDDDVAGPTHFTRAKGCRVTSGDGDEYIDCTMALGAVSLGYAEARVTNAVIQAANNGNVSGLSSILEIEVADRLCSFVPCAEQAQFLKSGAEAVSAAVRIARLYTGRSRVIASGYLGWHDWASEGDGVPADVRRCTTRVPFDDTARLFDAVAAIGDDLAAIVLEPVQERLPSDEWIATARSLSAERGALLVFDELKTGFRFRSGGFQEYSGVLPDLATFGKALANGYPLAAVAGPRAIMECATRSWISSTLASESTSLAAALAVLDWHEQADVCDALWSTGGEMRGAVAEAIVASGVSGVEVQGVDVMWFLRWDEPARESAFLAHALAQGLLLKRGAYNFPALAHDAEALREIEAAMSAALVSFREEEEG